MYFQTNQGKSDISSFAQVATFFIDKFPAAFGATATYTNAKKVTSEDAYIRIDMATSIDYDFAEGSEQHAQTFAPFQSKVLEAFKKGSEAESAAFLLELLINQKTQILQLPTSVRQAECTIQRFFLLLWPLLNIVESGNYDQAKSLTKQFVSLLCDQSDFSLKIKVDCLIQLYNSVHTNTGIKSFAFSKLVNLTAQNDSFDIIAEKAKTIVKDSASWNLTRDERRELYQAVGRTLDSKNLSSAAFRVIHANLRLYEEEDGDLTAVQDDARRCIILAIKAVDVINFAELEDLSATKQLKQKQSKVFSLLNLFTQASAQEFKIKLTGFQDLMKSEGLTEHELILKKSYVQICTLSTDKTNFSFTELSQLLNIPVDEIEFWAIEAIQNKIIDAKIDQLNEVVVIKSHMLREIKLQEWVAIQQKIRAWKDRFQRVQSIMQAATQAAQVPQV